jgi:hypothetical protein
MDCDNPGLGKHLGKHITASGGATALKDVCKRLLIQPHGLLTVAAMGKLRMLVIVRETCTLIS